MTTYYSYLSPIIFKLDDVDYFVWGYITAEDVITGIMATTSTKESWVDSCLYEDKELVEEFKRHLPEHKLKRKAKRKKK